ncbi:MAG TPA: BtpA/SgcQ family protein, partial [Phycisphaerales bacterium]|nr:BtpA/SgcQ family protein [Phycisphaerales bacterium]
VAALPGTPRCRGALVREIAERAAEEAGLLVRAGFDGVMIENMHDTPYLAREVGPEIVAGMTAAAIAVRDAVKGAAKSAGAMPALGIQILGGANAAAVAVAHAAGFDFVRAEGFVFAAVADEGLLERADAGPLLRYRKMIGADGGPSGGGGAKRVHVLADIKKKHSSHAITGDVDIAETARAAEFFGADGVIVTGVATGRPANIDELRAVREATALPVLVGSGATAETVGELFKHADAVIVGSAIKQGGVWSNGPEESRARAIVKAADRVRGKSPG